MPSAMGLKIEDQSFVGENPALLRIQYDVYYID